ncbi:hypothetical protein QOZ80_6AG0538540 [Eleusine coracana subsp. coracana]|nr:hypothetical protein QOZ80_6AG0538540 [Eleusine coracana subsp. coracana]
MGVRCAGVLLAILLSLSSLSASTAEAHKERLSDNAALLTGRKWLRDRKIMAAPGHGDSKKDEVTEGKGAESTGANTVHVHGEDKTVEVSVVGLSGESAGSVNLDVDASAEAVHEKGKRSKVRATHVMFQEHRHSNAAAMAPELLSMDYNDKQPARHHRPINNAAPLDVLAKKP